MIDARGLSCPMPVVMVRNEVRKNHPDEFEVLLDNACSVENVTRFGNNNGYAVEASGQQGEDVLLILKKR